MKQLNLGKYRQARIWIGELPEAIVPTEHAGSVTLPARNEALPARELAIEFSAGFTERSPYGLLGGTFSPANTGQLEVVVGSDLKSNQEIFASPLGKSWDKIYLGLPQEYADAVKKGVRLAQEWTEVSAGELIINRGAHAEVASSAWLFQHLAIILIRLLNTPVEEMTDAKILSVFADGIPSSNM